MSASVTVVAVSAAGQTTAGYLRIASLAIGLYDFLETLPSTWRFYREQREAPRFMLSTILFALLQATSIIALTVSNVGFFYSDFSDESCRRFFLVPPSFKVLQAMVSQAILGVRTFNISRRSSLILKLLLLCYGISCTLEWVSTIWKRIPVHDPTHGNCRAVSTDSTLGAWMYYCIAMIYDVITTTISVTYLLKFQMASNNSLMSKLVKMMLYDGLGYFAVLSSVNVVNLILYRAHPDIQTAATSMGYCVTWIMSQRLLLHLHKASVDRRNVLIDESITVTRDLEKARHIQQALRSQFESKPGMSYELTVPDFDMTSSYDGGPEEPEVHVRIEKTVTFEKDTSSASGVRELEDYSRKSQRSYVSRGHSVAR